MKAVYLLLMRLNYILLQAARFAEESNHQRKVQLFFTIILTLLEHQLLMVKQKCTPAALAADPKIDVDAMFRCITNAVKVCKAPNLTGKASCQSNQSIQCTDSGVCLDVRCMVAASYIQNLFT